MCWFSLSLCCCLAAFGRFRPLWRQLRPPPQMSASNPSKSWHFSSSSADRQLEPKLPPALQLSRLAGGQAAPSELWATWIELNWPKLNWTELNWTELNWTGPNSTQLVVELNWIGSDSAELDQAASWCRSSSLCATSVLIRQDLPVWFGSARLGSVWRRSERALRVAGRSLSDDWFPMSSPPLLQAHSLHSTPGAALAARIKLQA